MDEAAKKAIGLALSRARSAFANKAREKGEIWDTYDWRRYDWEGMLRDVETALLALKQSP